MPTYPVPSEPTVAVGDKITAAYGNADIRDAINFFLTPPRCMVYQTGTGQPISTATNTSIIWTDEVADPYGMHAAAVNPTRLIVPAGCGGVWEFSAQIDWPSGTGDRVSKWVQNGSAVLARWQHSANSAQVTSQIISPPVLLAAGDYVELQVVQTSGGSLTPTVGLDHLWAAAWWRSLT